MKYIRGFFSGLFIVLLILDSKTALSGALEGLDLSLRVVIPSLFPFFFLSILFTSSISDMRIPFLKNISATLGLPAGAEGLLISSFIGGYPVGAQAIGEYHRQGQLTVEDSRRMLAFCSNAGPAFFFGMNSRLFSSAKTLWLLWGIHILSAFLVGWILPGKSKKQTSVHNFKKLSLTDVLFQAIRAMAGICGWVVLFRVLLQILGRWLFWALPQTVTIILSGILELSNGCLLLNTLESEGLRFILCSVFLSLGGVCILMQTTSVVSSCGLGSYIPGKILQSVFSFLLASLSAPWIYKKWIISVPAMVLAAAVGIFCIVVLKKTQNKDSIPAICGV